jgi:hypothetical protein
MSATFPAKVQTITESTILTSIDVDIEHPDDGNVLIARRISDI